VTMGWNRRKTHPRCSITSIRRKGIFFHGIHAELSAILSLERGYALHGHDLWVYRRCTTRPGMARPCNYCWDVILDKGIRRVIFTTGEDSSPYDLVRLY
jgi:deoxycytidylate deaminase